VSSRLSGPAGTLPGLSRPTALCESVRVLFTGRGGGVSSGPFSTLNLSEYVGDDPAAVGTNRERVLRAIGPGPQRLAWMHQVHGTEVVFADAAGTDAGPGLAGPSPQADAIITDSPLIAVGALGADCAPVLVADPQARIVGAAHAGRPGMAAGVVPALIEAMTRAGADAGRMHAIIGPSVCGRCYEVPAQMRDEVASVVPESACVTSAGTPGLDLRAGLHAQLARAGLAMVSDDLRCTAESDELFSYRRDGQTGRFAGLIWLTP
jgi:YfiH family protein